MKWLSENAAALGAGAAVLTVVGGFVVFSMTVLATKADIKAMTDPLATKADIAALPTRVDFNAVDETVVDLRATVAALNATVIALRETVNTLNSSSNVNNTLSGPGFNINSEFVQLARCIIDLHDQPWLGQPSLGQPSFDRSFENCERYLTPPGAVPMPTAPPGAVPMPTAAPSPPPGR